MQPRTLPAPGVAIPSRRPVLLAAAAIALATLLAYADSFRVPFLFDDTLAITDNPSIRSLWTSLNPPSEHVAGVIARPFVNFTLALNYAIGGLDPFGYHLLNWFIHLLAALTLFGLVRRTCELPALRGRLGAVSVKLGFLTALLWAVHPLQTESVTCVVQRNEVLMGRFYLATLYCFVRGTQSAKPRWWWVGMVVACLLGMASKEVMVSAPLMVLLYDRTFVAGSFAAAWRARRKLYGALAGSWVLLEWLMLQGAQRGGTVGFDLGMAWWAYALKQCQAVVHYLWLSVWPYPLVLDYGTGVITDPRAVAPQIVLLLLLGAGTLWALVRRPWLGFLGAWVFVILAPSSSIVPLTTQTMAEHRMYLPLAALAVLAALGLWKSLGQRALAVGGALAGVLACVTFARNLDYQSALSIWADTAQKLPGNARAHYNYGCALLDTGRAAAAAAQFTAAIQADPDYADARSNLGNLLAQQGRADDAIAEFRQALRVKPDDEVAQYDLGCAELQTGRAQLALAYFRAAVRIDPEYTDALNALGSVLTYLSQPGEALGYLQTALRLRPDFPSAQTNYGAALLAAGEAHAAVTALDQALAAQPGSLRTMQTLAAALAADNQVARAVTLDQQILALTPNDPVAYYNYGNHLFLMQQDTQAVQEFTAALALRPDYAEAENNLGSALLRLNHFDEALAAFTKAVQLRPDYAEAQFNLGNAFYAHNQLDDAATHYEEAIRLNPNYAEAHNNLGSVFAKQGRTTEATLEYQEAIRLNPDYTAALHNLQVLQNEIANPPPGN